jgi:alanine racemase
VRPTLAEVDLDAIAANVRTIRKRAAAAQLCAVVKADAYGHGALVIAHTVLSAGADWLAVALVEEAEVLRDAGIDAPILLLSEPMAASAPDVVRLDVRPTVYSEAGVDAFAAAPGHPIHLKVNTGMNRVGADPAAVEGLARRALDAGLKLEGLWTHCPVADEPDDPFTAEQLDRFDGLVADLARAGIEPEMTHVANSAATLAHPASHRDLVRVGIALYGVAPSPDLVDAAPLEPAMTLRSKVSWVKRVAKGERISYGLTHSDTRTASPDACRPPVARCS